MGRADFLLYEQANYGGARRGVLVVVCITSETPKKYVTKSKVAEIVFDLRSTAVAFMEKS